MCCDFINRPLCSILRFKEIQHNKLSSAIFSSNYNNNLYNLQIRSNSKRVDYVKLASNRSISIENPLGENQVLFGQVVRATAATIARRLTNSSTIPVRYDVHI